MKFLTFSLITLLTSNMAFSQDDKMLDDIYKESFNKLSVGMTPEQQKKLQETLDKQKVEHKANMQLSQDEQEAKLDAGMKNNNTPEAKAAAKKEMENMSPEDKAMFDKMIENTNKLTDEMKK